jgi:hypothetical protein
MRCSPLSGVWTGVRGEAVCPLFPSTAIWIGRVLSSVQSSNWVILRICFHRIRTQENIFFRTARFGCCKDGGVLHVLFFFCALWGRFSAKCALLLVEELVNHFLTISTYSLQKQHVHDLYFPFFFSFLRGCTLSLKCISNPRRHRFTPSEDAVVSRHNCSKSPVSSPFLQLQ